MFNCSIILLMIETQVLEIISIHNDVLNLYEIFILLLIEKK